VLVAMLAAAIPAQATSTEQSVPQVRVRPAWANAMDEIIGNRPFSVTVGDDGETWYRHLDWVERPPASNQKLLLSMVLLDRLGTDVRIRTEVRAVGPIEDGVLRGDLVLRGHGDPEVDGRTLHALARRVRAAGVRRIAGGVVGATAPFERDWWATGWRDYFPDVYIARPTALTFAFNESASGLHLDVPELNAAQALTGRLRAHGVSVRDAAVAGSTPTGTHRLASVRSEVLLGVMRRMNVKSSNFRAEVLGKYLALATGHRPTIAAGARVVCAWIARRGPAFTCHDGSGLSYDNRATTRGIVDLLWVAERRTWGTSLRSTLARPGAGTLGDPDRLMGLTLRAKTGTLQDASALSGWVRSEIDGRWIAFSILSDDYDDEAAKDIEDRLVRLIAEEATDPTP
jgi:D-alanyl-D-alanine carboxypeptidase/D-alanyl-D-alanine-endopeptidase (penicillin-binding protein 4)